MGEEEKANRKRGNVVCAKLIGDVSGKEYTESLIRTKDSVSATRDATTDVDYLQCLFQQQTTNLHETVQTVVEKGRNSFGVSLTFRILALPIIVHF